MGFSADWLALREPADHAARDAGLLRQAAAAAGPAPVILDLGCGTGSTVRALSPHLPEGARWRLVDNDPELLERAASAAGAHAQTYRLDLADLEALPLEGVTLVTASALLDLMPEAWVRNLAARLGVPFYAALSYDGRMSWRPADPRDEAITHAFNRHQRSDKGMGAALGPDAAPVAATIFADAGFDVLRAPSDWQLGTGSAPLQAELLAGIAAAAAEVGDSQAEAWGAARIKAAPDTLCQIGHGDMLALPGNAAREAADAGA